jgi:hypothetical protein
VIKPAKLRTVGWLASKHFGSVEFLGSPVPFIDPRWRAEPPLRTFADFEE